MASILCNLTFAGCWLLSSTTFAADWPEWRGAGRAGVWNETGIIERFPSDGLKFRWRVPVHGGFAGPAVANGRVFVTDFTAQQFPGGTERLLCL